MDKWTNKQVEGQMNGCTVKAFYHFARSFLPSLSISFSLPLVPSSLPPPPPPPFPQVLMSELELQLQASLASTHNGSFLWRIPEIARRRRDAIEERITSIYSPPFYTGRYRSMATHIHMYINAITRVVHHCNLNHL